VMEAAKVEVVIEETSTAGGKLKTAVRVEVEIDMPEQNESLPHVLEETTVKVGQAFMREYYRQAIEKADLELVLNNRAGKDGEGYRESGRGPTGSRLALGPFPSERYESNTRAILRLRSRHRRHGTCLDNCA